MMLVQMPSPNFNDRPDGVVVDSIVIHYTGMKTAQDALDRLCDKNSEVSAHYTIDLDGMIYAHVDPRMRAWHAGVSSMSGRNNFNDFSIGIELVNKGHEFGYHAFPDEQIESLIDLIKSIYQDFPINPKWVVGHSEVAPDRKKDPGELFPWNRLVQENLAIQR